MLGQRLASFLLLVSALASSSLAEEDKTCTIHVDGNFYDLNPLRNREDYELKTSGSQKLFLNVCGGLHSDLVGLKDAKNPGGFVRRGHSDFSIGSVNQTLSLTESGPRLTFTEGSYCKTSSDEVVEKIRASSVIDFICDMSVLGTGKPRLVAQLPPIDEDTACGFYFEWKTHYACPTSGNSALGFFAVLAIIALVLVVAYTVLGTLYNRYVLQLRGFDQIPQFSFESMRYHAHQAIDWFRDIMSNFYEQSQHAGGGDLPFRRPGGSANAPNPFSHFTQTNNGNEFIRPRDNAGRKHDINPVSHQSQVQNENATDSSSPQLSSPPPQPSHPRETRKLDKDVVQNSILEEQRFMLADEDDDAGQEMDVVGTSSPQSLSVQPPSDLHEE
ncbi:hypothetical protein M378DRAFT_154764 [Amanita muscaria Koide BX008]|uniref:Autophagy-related protein 27 n=1 Tax=Amanita muscaria (strain Koide BX008) TaxID=946122 RepID=A0A0C2XPW6_AMAMK|nr:hypothetical protein M378DRAFT_154764 [Amanita muscaria Koide BX008]